jgi:hypothetical protein
MKNCPICGREKSNGWCLDCSAKWEDLLGTAEYLAEWAADRAREFEKEKAKVLVEALKRISDSQNEESIYDFCDSFSIQCAEEALEEYDNGKA